MNKLTIIAIVAAVLASGCAGNISQRRFAAEYNCPPDRSFCEGIAPMTHLCQGCGHRVTYVCRTMGSGPIVCDRDDLSTAAPTPAPTPPPVAAPTPSPSPSPPVATTSTPETVTRVPQSWRGSTSTSISAGILDGIGLSLFMTGAYFQAQTLNRSFDLPFWGGIGVGAMSIAALADTIMLTRWHHREVRRGLAIPKAPIILSWILTGLTNTFAGMAWSYTSAPPYEDTYPYIDAGIAFVTLAAITEIANMFIRQFWWRREIIQPRQVVVIQGR